MATAYHLPTFLLGIIVLAYLFTFVLFAILRILTGISIQRIGRLSLKRISYEPKVGVKLEIRKLGLLLHRPTFAQPTWVSIVVSDSLFSVDLRKKREEEGDAEEWDKGKRKKDTLKLESGGDRGVRRKSRAWKGIKKLRESLKRVHKLVKWLQMVDIVFSNTNLSIADVGSVQIGSMTMILDTRRKTADRNRMFDHTTDLKEDQNPIEWMFTARSVLFFPERKKEPIEVLDHCNFNIYGLLENGLDVFRDAAMALKVGKITIPLDEILGCLVKLRAIRGPRVHKPRNQGSNSPLGVAMGETSMSGSTTQRMTETVMESKEFLESLLRGVKEVQFAIGYLLISKSVRAIQPLKFLVGMKELAIDVHRLDQKSPAHRMSSFLPLGMLAGRLLMSDYRYFSPHDIAHQALLAAISISISVDDGTRKDKVFYIPMVTMTSKTTLPSKTIQLVEKPESNRNANILFANVVITSPSIDLEPRHLPILLALLQSKPTKPPSGPRERTHLISKLLPKASINFSVHEPVIRILLPSNDPQRREAGDMDMLISSLSSISSVVDSSHEMEDQNHYSLACSFRITSHHLYYQAYSGEKHDLLQTDAFDIRFQINSSPEVEVTGHAYLETFSLRLVRPEIVQGIKQMVVQFHRNVKSDKSGRRTIECPNFLRRMPLWLDQFKMEGVDFSVEVAGIDKEISEFTRGVALQLDSWTVDYRARRGEGRSRPSPRRRAASRSLSTEDTRGSRLLPPGAPGDPTDGRKLGFHIRGLQGYMVDSPDSWEQDPFLNIPHFDIAFSTSGGVEGPVLHIHSVSKSIFFNYSLYRHYTCIIATKVLKEAFGGTSVGAGDPSPLPMPVDNLHLGVSSDTDHIETPISFTNEFISFELKVQHVRWKASMPNDPPMMLEVFGLDAGSHRWGFPHVKAKTVRLYAESPKVKDCWARLISIRQFRTDLRKIKRKHTDEFLEDKSIDLSADAVRLAIPHQLVLYKLTDNIINTIKASQQMHNRSQAGASESVLEKKVQPAKNVPMISLRTKALLFELEDDPFETQLGLIYRQGLSEQKKRLAREAAFNAKVKKMDENERRKSSETTRTALKPIEHTGTTSRLRGRTRTWVGGPTPAQARAESPARRLKSACRNMRYDPKSAAGPSDDASIPAEEAWEKLQEHNSTAWIKRMKRAQESHSNRARESREMFWGRDEVPYDVDDSENILGLPMRPALMAAYFNDVEIVIDKPSFTPDKLPKFMHKVGKGLPEDTQFALLVPVSIKLDFSEGRVLLRDYPLPLIHVPRMMPSQANRSAAWSLKADFVLAEELRGPESMRHVEVNIVPPPSVPGTSNGGFAIHVRRTVSPVKSYSAINIAINTCYATRITWCTSYQPAIQDMMMVFETFTKPHFDPSERTGFWDKIRLVLHSQIAVNWQGDGDVHLTLKGSRDPYEVTGVGAGFVLCWRGDVQWEIAKDEDPRKFMKVDSEEFLLAIPDFAQTARGEFESTTPAENRSVLSSSSSESAALFKKVIMKLSGRVRWVVGLMFEREISADGSDCAAGKTRSFELKPHYEVTLKNPSSAKAPPGQVYDAFRGFRSHHLHLSLSIVSPIDRDWSPSSAEPSTSYNTIHLTPRFFTHFFSWWGLFSGVMSLPIRQGRLWPGPEKSNKKFGRHLATIKYKLCLSPLFISHIYKHNDKDEAGNDVVMATGLKARLDSFMVDIHQRREGIGRNQPGTAMRINQAELDFHSADIRAVSAEIAGATADELMKQAVEAPLLSLAETIRYSGDMSQFSIPDGNYSWIDMDDFVELDWVLPNNKTPKTKIMPLAFAPRFTYFRQTDHTDSKGCVVNPSSPFGDEPTHDCLMSENNDPREIQCGLVQARLEKVNEQMNKNKAALDSLAQHIRLNPDDINLKSESEELIEQSSVLFNKLNFLQTMLRRMSSKLEDKDKVGADQSPDHESSAGSDTDSDLLGMDSAPFDYISDFDNRFIVHNMQAKWNNSLRNVILKYIHQVSQRRGFVYYMSRRAVKFILDIVQEQKQSGLHNSSSTTGVYTGPGPTTTPCDDSDITIESRIQQLLDDENKYVVADERPKSARLSDHTTGTIAGDDLTGDVAEEYLPVNSYHVRLIAPQIQMQSEKNKSAAVFVAAQGMQLKVVSIMDRDRVGDEVSGLVQRRFALNLENTQFFVSHRHDFASQSMSLHSANRYGAPSGSCFPPWVPLESMFDFRNLLVGFSRVVERTSATLRYDKYNSLRLKYSDQISGGDPKAFSAKCGPVDTERRIDQVYVDFPKVEATCYSSQYFAMYIIVLDLLLYAEPLEKLRSEKLEKIMLASDFSDLTGAPEMVERLQNRIHQLEEIKTYFQINSQNLDIEGWRGRVAVDEDLAGCEEELFFMMKAITTAQRKHEDRASQASGILRWYLTASEIIWHMICEKRGPLMDIKLQSAGYERMDNADGSNFNTVEVDMMQGYNLLPDAVYPVMITPFVDPVKMATEIHQTKILRVNWHMLEAIAGIPVMDHFEVNLFPLRIQLERDVGERIFEYIFPGVGKHAFENGGFSPFMVHSMKSIPDGSGTDDTDDDISRDGHSIDDSSSAKSEQSPVEIRLRPTLSLATERPGSSSSATKARTNSFKSSGAGFRGAFMPSRTPTHKSSIESLSVKSRKSLDGPAPSISGIERNKKLQIFHRSGTNDDRMSDELSEMMSRASNYMTLAYIKIPSVALCLSYKGRGESNFEDIHEFVFRMPMLEYRNKTWSNLDLAIRLKKDIMRALISHTGAILQNKLTHHRPSKPHQSKMVANNGSLGAPSNSVAPDSKHNSKVAGYTTPPGDTSSIARPSTGYLFKPPPLVRPKTSPSPEFTPNTSTTFYTPSLADTLGLTEEKDDKGHGIFHNTLGRHLSNLGVVARHRDSTMDESEESVKRKSRLLLGKKVFGSL